jgi:ABC-type glycerol-3-phosphate transport system permease component
LVRHYAGLVVYHAVMLAVGAAVMMPFVWMLSTSLKPEGMARLFPPRFIPNPIRPSNYVEVFTAFPFLTALANSTKIAVSVIIGQLLSCSLAGYAFARLRFPGRSVLFMVLLSTMMIPGSVTIIPVFLEMKTLGWINTHLPLIVPSFFGGAFGTFVLRQYFLTIPRDYNDSATMDGANEIQTLFFIYMPMSLPALATIGVFTFLGSWNAFLAPLIFIRDVNKMTMTLALSAFTLRMYNTPITLLMAGAVANVTPTVILYVLAQRYFIRSMVLSGLKG